MGNDGCLILFSALYMLGLCDILRGWSMFDLKKVFIGKECYKMYMGAGKKWRDIL